MMLIAFGLLTPAAQAPSLCSASKLLSQLVEPGVPISPTTNTKQKTPPLARQGFVFGTSGRTRTGTLLRAGDFESPMSTNSITLAF